MLYTKLKILIAFCKSEVAYIVLAIDSHFKKSSIILRDKTNVID